MYPVIGRKREVLFNRFALLDLLDGLRMLVVRKNTQDTLLVKHFMRPYGLRPLSCHDIANCNCIRMEPDDGVSASWLWGSAQGYEAVAGV